MGGHHPKRPRWPRVVAAIGLASLAAACGGDPKTAAPVILKGAPLAGIPSAPAPPPTAAPPTTMLRRIVVRPGQSVSGLAREHRVSRKAIIAANHLKPPYQIEAGQQLIVPVAADAQTKTAGIERPARKEAEAAEPPSRQAAAASEPRVRKEPDAEPPVRKTAAHVEPAERAEIPSRPAPADHTPVKSRAAAKPEIIPLDDPPPSAKSADPPKITFPARVASSETRPPAEAPAQEKPRAEAAAPQAGGRHFPWPVRGRILAAYGAVKGGGHNDGINISAPRGAAVRAIESGVVAYAGNEIRGYGNLVLVKHPNGFISAYAHCDELLVKRGDKVARGHIIARVGATGGVTEPQLHFELRRGKRAVDPRDFLAPISSASDAEHGKQG